MSTIYENCEKVYEASGTQGPVSRGLALELTMQVGAVMVALDYALAALPEGEVREAVRRAIAYCDGEQ